MHLFIKILIIANIFIFTSCSRTPEDIVKKYLNADKIEERLACVKQDNDVIQIMKKKYDDDFFEDRTDIGFKNFRFKSVEVNPGEYIEFVKVRGYRKSNPDEYEDWIFYLTKGENDNYLIDWKASNGIADMTVKALKVQRPQNPTLLYVNAELSNYYNFEFVGTQRTNLSIRLFSNESSFDYIYGYVRKNTPAGEELYSILKDGDTVPVTLEVSFTPYDRGGDVVSIDAFLHEYWGNAVIK